MRVTIILSNFQFLVAHMPRPDQNAHRCVGSRSIATDLSRETVRKYACSIAVRLGPHSTAHTNGLHAWKSFQWKEFGICNLQDRFMRGEPFDCAHNRLYDARNTEQAHARSTRIRYTPNFAVASRQVSGWHATSVEIVLSFTFCMQIVSMLRSWSILAFLFYLWRVVDDVDALAKRHKLRASVESKWSPFVVSALIVADRGLSVVMRWLCVGSTISMCIWNRQSQQLLTKNPNQMKHFRMSTLMV